MAQDEGRFGRINIPRRCWAPLGTRPIVFAQTVRQYVYAYSVVCPATGDITSLILPYADTKCMNIFLEHVAQEYPDYFIIMQADNAGWHKSKGLKIPENIKMIYQPAYSPQVNPVEHIWDEIRKKHKELFKQADWLVISMISEFDDKMQVSLDLLKQV